jgi:hypothetical protein
MTSTSEPESEAVPEPEAAPEPQAAETAETGAAVEPRKRPFTVWVLTVLLGLYAGLTLLVFVLLVDEIRNRSGHGQAVPTAAWIGMVFYMLLTALYVVLAVFIFRGRPWARLTGLVLVSLNLVFTLLTGALAGNTSGCLAVLPQIALFAVLMNRDVKAWCSR